MGVPPRSDHLIEKQVSKTANIRTDGCAGYKPLKKDYPNLVQENSGTKGENFPEMHKTLMMFKAWLRGIHHSVKNLQAYIDEYTYQFNRSFMTDGIFDNLLAKLVAHLPYPYFKVCMY